MYDCSGPMLVFVTQCHHPLLGHHTGYLFAEYDVLYDEPRELFFEHIASAQTYAIKRGDARNMELALTREGQTGPMKRGAELHNGPGMQLIMNPDAKPERLSSLTFLACLQDDARFPAGPPEEKAVLTPEEKARRQVAHQFKQAEYYMRRKAKKASLAAINFFGEDA